MLRTTETHIILNGRPALALNIEIVFDVDNLLPQAKLRYKPNATSWPREIPVLIEDIRVKKTGMWEQKRGKEPEPYETTIVCRSFGEV